VPADAFVGRDALGEPIQVAVGIVEPLVPQPFPGEQLGILDQQAPKGDERPVGGSLPGAQRRGPALERQIAFAGPVGVDPGLARRVETVGAATPLPPPPWLAARALSSGPWRSLPHIKPSTSYDRR